MEIGFYQYAYLQQCLLQDTLSSLFRQSEFKTKSLMFMEKKSKVFNTDSTLAITVWNSTEFELGFQMFEFL